MTKNQLISFMPALISLFFLSLGVAVLSTAQTVALHYRHYPAFSIGLITTAFYAGFVYSAFKTEKFIIRVGHIRAFATFASTFTAMILLQGIIVSPIVWFFLRLVSGVCVAGLFVTIESWMLCGSTLKNRGQLLAVYMVVYYAAQSLGQFLLYVGVVDILRLFSIGATFCALSIIPLAMTKAKSPKIEEPSTLSFKKLYQQSPSGMIGSCVSGLLLGPIYGLFPLYFAKYIGESHVAVSMALVIFGGMLFQFPLGRLSDLTNRRMLIFFVFLVQLLCSFALLIWAMPFIIYYWVLFILGGMAFAIYPLSITLACDTLNVKDMVGAIQGLILANSIGMAVGPFVASALMNIITIRDGLFGFFVVVSLVMAVFYCFRLFIGKRIKPKDRQEFIAMSRTTPVAAEIDPRSDEN